MYHGEIENLSDSSNTASHVSGVSQARSEAAQLIDRAVNLSISSESEAGAEAGDPRDEEIRRLKRDNNRLKRTIREITGGANDGSESSDGGGGDARKMWAELGPQRKKQLLFKICRDMCKLAEDRGTGVENIAANIIAR